MTGNIIWIASYPKSGNTWLRIFFSCLQEEGAAIPDINGIETDGIASSRMAFEQCTGLDSTSLSNQEITSLRPGVYDMLSRMAQKKMVIKVHDAFQLLANSTHLFPITATQAACYLIRNPLDVAVSYANHNGQSIDETIKKMNDHESELSKQVLNAPPQLPQYLGSWSRHIKSWTETSPYPVCIIRYEDMLQKPVETFSKAANAVGIHKTSAEIASAIDASAFDKLKNQELEFGFRERPHTSSQFFRSGKAGSWRDSLTERQAGLIIEENAEIMQRYGYLDSNGTPTY